MKTFIVFGCPRSGTSLVDFNHALLKEAEGDRLDMPDEGAIEQAVEKLAALDGLWKFRGFW